MKKIKNKNPEIKMEKCISCGIETDEPLNRHIDHRRNYVEGAGQLCPGCYERIYGK